MRCRRPAAPDATSVSRFHEALHFGRVDDARRLIHQNPSLANARSSSSPHATSLMVSATSDIPPLRNILSLVQLLLAKGASLRTKDDHRRTVLMAVCASGAHPNVVKCLLDHDSLNSNRRVLLWSDQDAQGLTALGLACFNGHGRLASFILDLLGPDEEIGTNSPLHALHFAIKSRDERSVMDLLRNRKLRWGIRENRREEKLVVHGEWNQPQRQREEGDNVEEVTVSSCVAAAVEQEMVDVVTEMHRLNRRCVGHATWFTLCSEERACKRGEMEKIARVRPEFADIADLHRRDCIWERIQLLFLVRYASERNGKSRQLNIVAELPDSLFRIVAGFLKPQFDDAEETQKERFKSVLDLSSW
ncbi:hypothetical protein PF005_g15935 [Phytophthora fragariae]|uniref:Uncharacterized protein n=2 Tax=Phytophthora TaxID=4783 RepID=A0A6A4CZT5_9STRA|nr:hypothetical protein PF003_g35482 [Phytophthora fragariae]KAE8985567.1 hypothetical protein PR001_g22853 [Phytophthora rubi]KAE8932692.1 hypothetical protein PF009_g17293 [Phytophthora fragariae]KAE8998583.1 hypothetical protein PF011_g14997 [Phytophthora fragariae]KAE9098410.1 hypothetical protein PF007_g16271 [Phytophthora fragariae]